MTYRELLEKLFTARRGGAVLELDRVRHALAKLGDLRAALPLVVQIGGTNGKGSTAAFYDAIAREAGARVGLFTSPHLSRVEERFSIDGRPASEDAVLAAGEAVATCDPDGELTFFEQVALIAARLFADAGVDIAIFEVGLGGRLDATTALGADVAAVTGVALDHTKILGADIPAIAAEKAGIFGPGQEAVIGRSGRSEAIPLLERAAQGAGARRVRRVTEEDEAEARELAGEGGLGLKGAHQAQNAACALAVADAAEALGAVRARGAARARGLARARFPGRLEKLGERPRVIADGAHNPDAARALADALGEIPRRRLILVAGGSADKDLDAVIGPLAALADAVVATRAENERARPEEEVAAIAARHCAGGRVEAADSVEAALARARAQAHPDDAIVIAGSLFVVGEARRAIVGGEADPFELSDPAVVTPRR